MKILAHIYQHVNKIYFLKSVITILFLITFVSCNQKSDHSVIAIGLPGSTECPGGIIQAYENTKTKSYLIVAILYSDPEIFIDPYKKPQPVIKINGYIFHYEINHFYILDKNLNVINIQQINKIKYDKILSGDWRLYTCQ